uniref:Uncharacterized protein n=1 Tax=Rhizophora mucronata TaxID=61149 RepID=A0A2P2PC07_RHIMU
MVLICNHFVIYHNAYKSNRTSLVLEPEMCPEKLRY